VNRNSIGLKRVQKDYRKNLPTLDHVKGQSLKKIVVNSSTISNMFRYHAGATAKALLVTASGVVHIKTPKRSGSSTNAKVCYQQPCVLFGWSVPILGHFLT